MRFFVTRDAVSAVFWCNLHNAHPIARPRNIAINFLVGICYTDSFFSGAMPSTFSRNTGRQDRIIARNWNTGRPVHVVVCIAENSRRTGKC